MKTPLSRAAILLGSLSAGTIRAFNPSKFNTPAGNLSSLSHGNNDPFDHSDIRHYAALGDSFAAGLGAGTRLRGWGDWYCSRYDNSYPFLLNTDPSLGDSSKRKFDFWACSGAKANHVLTKQIPSLDRPDLVTLSIGGNDANLKEILHACVFQWNKDPMLDCDKTLSDTQAAIDDPKFAQSFDDILNALKPKMANRDSKIYWTGYSKFWDDSSNDCDSVTWAFKYNYSHRQYLTQARRKKMNDLTDAVNQKIKEATDRAGDQVIFASWEGGINYITGHFCEPGVNEWIAADREQTAFYEWSSTLDDKDHIEDKDELRKRQATQVVPPGENLDDTFEGAITKWILEAMKNDSSIKPADLNMTNDDLVHAQGGLLLPDSYGRIFHPQKYGHAMIAEAVLRSMNDVKAKSMGQKFATTTLIGCPAPTGVASHPGEHDKCYSDEPPDGNGATFQVDDANSAIHDYCAKHKTDTIGGGDGIVDNVPNGGDHSSSLELRAALANDQACDNYPNKGDMNFFDCSDNFGAAMNDCNEGQSTKNGGARMSDCIWYSIRATKTSPTATSTAAPYAEGQCSLHLSQTAAAGFVNGVGRGVAEGFDGPVQYQVSVKIHDAKGAEIGNQDPIGAGDGNALRMKSKLEDPLVITPEADGDRVRFELPGQRWDSRDARCRVGGWDPKGSDPQQRQMDCTFNCKWNGGKSSDGSS